MATRFSLLLLLFFARMTYSQIGDTTKFDPDTKRKMVTICDSLKGEWILINKFTIDKKKTDVINQAFSDKSKSRTPTSRPKIILNFKSNGDLIITEFPHRQESSVTKAKWKVELRPFDTIALFYIEIYNSSDTNITDEFNGFISDFERNQFILLDQSPQLATKQWTEINLTKL